MPEPSFKFRDLKMSLAPLHNLARKSPAAFNKASKKGAVVFLGWANNGSTGSSKKPPIRWGVLRGSASAFVGNELVNVFDIAIKSGAKGQPTPARSHSAPPMTITWVWNTNYAAKMHEWTGKWGKFTRDDGNAGNKWLEEHLRADEKALMEVIKTEFHKAAGL